MTELDRLAKRLTKLPRQKYASNGADKDMPRLLWSDGVTGLTNITANYKVGIMFTIVVISLQFEGVPIFQRCIQKCKIIKGMIECFQMILCNWMWLKKRNTGKEMTEIVI